MDIVFQQNKKIWNAFLIANESSFLQSWEWGEFQKKLGKKIWRFQNTLIIKEVLPFGKNFLYIPFGLYIKKDLLEEIKDIAKAERSVYCYVEPVQGVKLLASLQGVSLSAKRIQPQKTLVLDLTPPEEQIFKNLKSKTTRYNIRFAQKAGLQFESLDIISKKEIDIFYDLAQKSAKRDNFSTYNKDYFTKLFSVSSKEMQVKLFFAKYDGNIIASNILVFFNKTATHLFGGFDHSFRSLMAPYFMHWNQMLFAKNKMNCEVYDFWGIDEKKWPGVTHFKSSFGGKEIIYPQGYDIVFNKAWYKLFKLARKILKK